MYFDCPLSELAGADFSIVYADPAWTYDDKALAGNRGAGCKYSLMTNTDLYALPVADIATDDCVLFMWATYPKLAEALACGAAWGFTYKTCAFTWVKPNRPFAELLALLFSEGLTVTDVQIHKALQKVNTLWAIGMGRWTRANAEVCLLFTRGKPTRMDAGVNQVICWPSGEHSVKPPEARDRIVRLMGDVPRIELFARGDANDGWERWGNEPNGPRTRDMEAHG